MLEHNGFDWTSGVEHTGFKQKSFYIALLLILYLHAMLPIWDILHLPCIVKHYELLWFSINSYLPTQIHLSARHCSGWFQLDCDSAEQCTVCGVFHAAVNLTAHCKGQLIKKQSELYCKLSTHFHWFKKGYSKKWSSISRISIWREQSHMSIPYFVWNMHFFVYAYMWISV